MASARMKLPRKRKIMGSANGANTAFAGAMPDTTHSSAPIRAVMGIGMGSVTHHVTTQPSTAARRCADGVSDGMGAAYRIAATSGPKKSPSVCRQRSKRSSAGESISCAAARVRVVLYLIPAMRPLHCEKSFITIA